jgi:hypothetical protein
MCKSATTQQLLVLMLASGLSNALAAAEYSFPVAGVSPWQRPAGAPVMTQFEKDASWYSQALHGVTRPYPPSLRFLEDQGAWHTPFNRPGMPPPYDLRGWYTN